MNNLNGFLKNLGEIVFYYQLLESDLRKIYACMKKGDLESNLSMTYQEFKGLGEVIRGLKVLDNQDNNPYFSDQDYDLLLNLSKKRNYYCHKVSLKFIYIKDFEKSMKFIKCYQELEDDLKTLKMIENQAENLRIDVYRRFRG